MSAFLAAFGPPEAAGAAVQAFASMAHHAGGRPGSTATWEGTGVFLGFHATVLPAGMARAAVARDGDLAVAGDIRIDNRAEVARALGLARVPDDHALVLAAYRQWGRGAAARLVGEFAVAVWDGSARTLWLARDALGVRPVHYAQAGGGFVAASDMDAFLSLPGFPLEVSEAWVRECIARPAGITETPPLAALACLRPAHEALVRAGGEPSVRRYWTPDPRAADGCRTREDYGRRLRELVLEAVRCRIGPPGVGVGVGVQLSGGLDSSSIAMAASGMLRQEGATLRGYGLVLPLGEGGKTFDERPHQQAVAAAGGIPLASIETPPGGGPPPAGRSPLALEQETGFMAEACARAAAADGVQVLLSGYGGDEFASFNARGLTTRWIRRGRWVLAWRHARARSAALGRPLWRELAGMVRAARPGGGRPADAWPLLEHLVRPEARRRLALGRVRLPAVRSDPAANQRLLLELDHCAARAVGDSTSASHHGVEFRYPLMDRRLVEFALLVPAEHQVFNGYGRGLFRTAMEGILPPSVQWRRDKGNANPWGTDFFRQALRAAVGRVRLIPRGGLADAYFDLDGIQAQLEALEREWPPLGVKADDLLLRRKMLLAQMASCAELLAWADARAGRPGPRPAGSDGAP